MQAIEVKQIDNSISVNKSEVNIEQTTNNIQNLLVKEFQEHNITIYGTYDKPLFKAKDIGNLLGIKNIRDTIKDFSNKQKVVVLTDTLGGNQETLFLTEKGLYKVLMKSRKSVAEKFQDWVCEVIEQIRKTGKYETEKYIEDRAKSNLLVEQSVDKSINYIGVVEESENNMIVKYGRTNYIRETLNRHQITYGENFYFIHTVECDRNHDLEKLIQNHDSLKSRHIKVYKENPRQELLKLDNDFTKKDLIKLVEDLKETLYDKHILDLEKEKTKQIEQQTIQVQEQEKTKQLEQQTIQEQEKTKQLDLKLKILELQQKDSREMSSSVSSSMNNTINNSLSSSTSLCNKKDDKKELVKKFLQLETIITGKSVDYINTDELYNKLESWIQKNGLFIHIPRPTFNTILKSLEECVVKRMGSGSKANNTYSRTTVLIYRKLKE